MTYHMSTNSSIMDKIDMSKHVSEAEGLAQHARYAASLVGFPLPGDSTPISKPPSRVEVILPRRRALDKKDKKDKK